MRITQVSYTRLINLGDFENCRIGAEAQVDPGDDPVMVVEQLRQFVQQASQADLATAQAAAQQPAGYGGYGGYCGWGEAPAFWQPPGGGRIIDEASPPR